MIYPELKAILEAETDEEKELLSASHFGCTFAELLSQSYDQLIESFVCDPAVYVISIQAKSSPLHSQSSILDWFVIECQLLQWEDRWKYVPGIEVEEQPVCDYSYGLNGTLNSIWKNPQTLNVSVFISNTKMSQKLYQKIYSAMNKRITPFH